MRKFDLQSRVRLVPFGVSVAPYLSVADLHCSPSSLEAYPLNTLEAMSMGVPVVRYGVKPFKVARLPTDTLSTRCPHRLPPRPVGRRSNSPSVYLSGAVSV